MRRARVEKLFNRARWDHDPVLAAVIGQCKTLLKERQRFLKVVLRPMCDGSDRKRAGHRGHPSRLLCWMWLGTDTNQVPGVSRSVASGTSVVSGRSFVGAVHIRAGCIYTLHEGPCRPGQIVGPVRG